MQTIPVLGGRYRLGPEIGVGGMGAVHRAWDERFEREVAIKIVRSDADGVERERLRREAQYLARLDHQNLVAVLDAGEDRLRHRDTVWFAMELVEGPDLRALLRQDGAQGGAAVRRILSGLLAALEVLHRAGVVHRDMKPANVLLTAEPADGPRWDVKLVDLGIAYHSRTDHLTDDGQILGTAAYLSPEQVSGKPLGPASDVYALGLLTLEALTGRIAFPGGPAESATARLVRAPEIPAALDRAWHAILLGMTALDPERRPSVAALRDLARDLPDVAMRTDEQLSTATLPATEALFLADRQDTAVLFATPAAERTKVLPVPALRPRRHRPRRRLLATLSLLFVLAVAGGGAAVLTSAGHPAANAAPLSTPSHRPVAARSPSPAASTRSTTTARRSTATSPVTPPPATATATATATAAPQAAPDRLERAEKALRRIVEHFEHRGRHR